jgi:YidC/Oxa1 family membrane protein insertase
MNEKQRLILFVVLAVFITSSTQLILGHFGMLPKAPRELRKANVPVAKAAPQAPPGDAKEAKAEPSIEKAPAAVAGAAAAEDKVELIDPLQLRLGSTDKSQGYNLAVQLEQKGAGVAWAATTNFQAEFVDGQKRDRPLPLIQADPEAALVPPSFALTVAKIVRGAKDGIDEIPLGALDGQVWEVVRDAQGRAVRPVTGTNPLTNRPGEGQEVTFRATAGNPAITVTKHFRLWKGADGFDLSLEFSSPSGEETLVYRLMGPHGIPIEGEWYTGTFRDVFFGQKGVDIVTRSAADVVKEQGDPKRLSASPLLYAGVENQYFAVLIEPVPPPTSNEDSRVAETIATVVHDDPVNHMKADVTVQLTSKPITVAPDVPPVAHQYRIFAGPKRSTELALYGAPELASYRKNGWISIPFASTLAQSVISPMLDRIYALTKQVAGWFGWRHGNYGIAIILLTITVRLFMFPLSRKQAISAKKMQDLQPLMVELKEKYKDDKERMTKETFALYKRYGVNPMGGCIPGLIQLPIFVGLWQALNNSVALRHAPFLWIQNLAAPDMLFHFPTTIPFLGDYFNILPFLVVALMLVQSKLFAPPPTTPEAEMQMKMMKYMMVFMAFMFYKVPSGLGIYFITSSLWAIGERLLLPKLAAAHALAVENREEEEPPQGGSRGGLGGGGGKGGPGGNGPGGGKGRPSGDGIGKGWLGRRLEKLLEEASQDRTVRNDGNKDREKDKTRPKARPGKRR